MQLRKQLLDIIINYLKLMIQCYSRQEYPSFNTIYCSAITSLKSPAYTCKRLLQLLPICTSHDDLIPTPAIRQYLGVNLKLAASQVRLAWSFELVLLLQDSFYLLPKHRNANSYANIKMKFKFRINYLKTFCRLGKKFHLSRKIENKNLH